MPLCAIPKAFEFDTEKGLSSFVFPKPENFLYKGIIPGEHYFMPNAMTDSKYDSFHGWHQMEILKGDCWEFFGGC